MDEPADIPSGDEPAATPATELERTFKYRRALVVALVGLFSLAIIHAIYLARPILLPILFGLILTLIFRPVLRGLERWHMRPVLGATLILGGLAALVVFGVFNLATPASDWMTRLPSYLHRIDWKVDRLMEPVERVGAVANQLDEMATMPDSPPTEDDASTAESEQTQADEPAADPDPLAEPSGNDLPAARSRETKPPTQQVEVTPEAPSRTLFRMVRTFMSQLALTLIMFFFMLAYGGRISRNLSHPEGTARLIRTVSDHVSAYLLTITVINFCLGLVMSLAMWLLDLPNPLLWGAMAFVFNFIPWLGALAGMIIIGLVALITFADPLHTLLVPMVYFAITGLEGHFITPMVLGQRFTLNPIFIFVWLIFWGWLWGIPGALIAIPLLMAFRIVCNHIEPLAPIGRILND